MIRRGSLIESGGSETGSPPGKRRMNTFSNQFQGSLKRLELREAKAQLSDWLGNSDKQRGKLFLWSLVFGVDFYIAKFLMAAANIIFTYNVFRVNAHWRADVGAKVLQRLINEKKVIWTPSEELEKMIVTTSEKVTQRAQAENAERSAKGVAANAPVWRWNPRDDIHDEVIEELEQQLHSPEFARTYRRARMQYFIHRGKERDVVE
ncbi:hypothetical protein HDV00_009965 [Rhizophlyctis rosea]|nr:hypothetical protein HDV00_009965 [Rhizophlyctis rosea]